MLRKVFHQLCGIPGRDLDSDSVDTDREACLPCVNSSASDLEGEACLPVPIIVDTSIESDSDILDSIQVIVNDTPPWTLDGPPPDQSDVFVGWFHTT